VVSVLCGSFGSECERAIRETPGARRARVHQGARIPPLQKRAVARYILPTTPIAPIVSPLRIDGTGRTYSTIPSAGDSTDSSSLPR